MKDSKIRCDQVYAIWASRPDTLRAVAHTEAFVDEMWQTGSRMGHTQSIHYQNVMATIRLRIVLA